MKVIKAYLFNDIMQTFDVKMINLSSQPLVILTSISKYLNDKSTVQCF